MQPCRHLNTFQTKHVPCIVNLKFPEHFAFGTSTSAYQIETPFEHDWADIRSRDGHIFNRTTDHERMVEEDVKNIRFLAPHYRMGLMWSKLQREPMGDFDLSACTHYHYLLGRLRSKGVKIMMVLHHFANPLWFAKAGGWESPSSIHIFVDFARKVVNEFGDYVTSWNTFNEPNLYAGMGWVAGEFPPFRKNPIVATKVLRNMAASHEQIYGIIKQRFPEHAVGISHNCALFTAENFLGHVPARVLDWCYMEYPLSLFRSLDFFGMSYYAKIAHDPFPITTISTPDKIKKTGRPHDDMWEYYPEGLRVCMERFWKQFKIPIIITENGICTSDDEKRVKALKDYLTIVHRAIEDGIRVEGYYHWSAWDNFEWHLGPTYRFGLFGVDRKTNTRFKKKSADVYSEIAHRGVLAV